MRSFYNNTNTKKIFEDSLTYEWKAIYDTFSEDEKWAIVEIYEGIDNKIYTNYNLDAWEIIDYLINLEIVQKNEAAIVVSDIYKNATIDNVFDIVNNYSLGIFEKAVILFLLGDYEPRYLSDSENNIVIDAIIDTNYLYEEKVTILEYFGYTIDEEGYVHW